MDDDFELTGEELFAHACLEGHEGCYELSYRDRKWHFVPSQLDEYNAKFIAALDEVGK
jgi:hypothetical protein